jgi:ATP-dependent RNA helicase RhlE
LTSFSKLGLAAPILKALDDEGYSTPTPIQTKAIPRVLAGSDLLGIAQTGTGKTAAFALPIIHRLGTERRTARHKGCRVLVLSPTRELATQIGESFLTYGR